MSPSPSVEPLAPSRDDPFVRGASRMIGGPWGRHAAGPTSRWWTPLRVLLALTVLTGVLGYAQKSPCRTHAWAQEYQYTRMCYTDVYALYFAEGLAEGKVPYRDHAVEYPVVIGGLMWVAAQIASGFAPAERAPRFFDLTALLLVGAALVMTWTTARLAGRERVWDAAMVALAPTLLVHAFTNWDLAAVALAGLGMYFWGRRAPVWAGVCIGLGVATKLYPVLLLAGLLLLCWRAGRLRAWGTATAAAAATWLVVDVPVWALYPASFARFYSMNRTRTADWDSLWFAWQHWRGKPFDVGTLNVGVAICVAAVVGLVCWLVVTAPRRPRVPQVLFLLVAGFLLVNKVDSPQYALWLVPLAVLARPRWPAFLAWQLAEAWLLFTRFYFFVQNDRPGQGLDIGWFISAVLLRDALLVLLIVLVVREVRRPALDVVRRGEVDDPAGGVLDAAPDRSRASARVPAAA